MASPKAKKSKEKSSMSFGAYIRRYWQLYLLLLLPMLYLLIFKYIPMIYIQIAFKKYSIVQSVWKMPLAANHGFQYFIQAFADRDFRNALRNTVVLNLLDLVIGFPIPIIFAIVLNELPFQRFKKFTQTVAYMPHFLSWVIIYGLALQLFASSTGLINRDLYEAAAVDGAGRFQRIWHITLPGIKPTIVILLIMAIGNIVGSNFDRPYALQNNLVMDWANVIATYVYRRGIKGLQFSLTTAVGFFQSVVGVFFLLGANWLSRKLGERGLW